MALQASPFCSLFLFGWLFSKIALQPPAFNILHYGAVPDGHTLCTTSIQNAIDRCAAAGGGRVLVPKGRFLTGSIWLKSGVELHLAKGAVLLGSTRHGDYGKNNWYALVLANGQRHIALTGKGTINGQGAALAANVDSLYKAGKLDGPYTNNRVHERHRPQLIDFEQCRHVLVSGITLRDAACWVQRYGRCDSLTLRRLRVRSRAYWNNDGIDLVDCRHTLVEDCDIDAADDGICLKSDRRELACDSILIRRCRVRSSASAVKFGTNSYGGFRNIRVENLDIRDTYRSAVALEIVDGGILKNIEIEKIRAKNTGNAFFLRLGHRNQRVPPGQFSDVRIRDLYVEVPARKPDAGAAFEGPPVEKPHNLLPSSIVGLPGHPIKDVLLENIRIRFAGGGRPEVAYISADSIHLVPECPKDYPEFSMFGELPAWGIFMRHVEGITMKDMDLKLLEPDYRPMYAKEDVRD
jgi:polygalacturonase